MASIDRIVRIRNDLIRCMASEFYGTFLLVFIAHSTGAAYSFASNSNDAVSKIMGSTFGVGCAALIALTVAMPVSGGHINPAITVGVATMGHFPWSRVAPYLLAQHLGGFFAGLMIYVTFYDPIQAVYAANSGNATVAAAKTAGLFCSHSASAATPLGSLIGSIWGTATFLIGIAAILDQKSHMKPPKWYWPLAVSFVLMISLAAFGTNGGPSVNPAADLAPRIAASLLGWGGVIWSPQGGHYWWIAGIVGPHVGAIFGLWSYRFFIAAHYPDDEEDAERQRNAVELEGLNKS